jgi:hypothetical protein
MRLLPDLLCFIALNSSPHILKLYISGWIMNRIYMNQKMISGIRNMGVGLSNAALKFSTE